MQGFQWNFHRGCPAGFSCLALFILAGLAAAQGSLTPPGAPAPMMRTLAQIEPRTPLNSVAGQAGVCQVAVAKPGSYYLTGNITGVPNLDCIRITTDGVTLDLNGFSLIGVPDSGHGIYASGLSDCVIRNGRIRNWGGVGIWGGNDFRIEGVTAKNNGGTGINVGGDSIITGCISKNNRSNGISLDGGAIVRECVSSNNEGAGVAIHSSGGQVLHCTLTDNTLNGISQSYGSGWLIAGNTLNGNQGASSLSVVYGALVLQNTISYNETGRGIYTSSGSNRIEGNHITKHDVGIYLNTAMGKNIMVNNSVTESETSNYSGTGSNNATSAAPTGTTTAAANPYANISIP